ncbi:pectate lyase [Flavobacterium sp. 1]|uniref:T9SS type A sorting domain-containing protein n=1 Tax=Flavobacterium sp. 1 TaxID=2035200 RepID=UPI000C23756F|nr:T9SS type A sorting domain-containing protein [Flavobacterium sp. 1]PJJ11082.1 pectate lyase [Flavobacterium sp. 1]
MRKLLFLGVFLLGLYSMSGQNYYMTSPQGFGAAATGGGTPTASNTVTVDTYDKLKTALTSTAVANSVILVSGTIDCSYTSVLLTNRTIIGLPGARLRNLQITPGDSPTSAANSGILYIKSGSNNVIIRNLIFEGPGAYDVDGKDNLTNEGTNIWVDHCEFQDGMDGNFDNKGSADNVSISWCKFTYLKTPTAGGSGGTADHRFTDLVGSSKSDFPTDGHYSITFQNCYWAEGCKERMPRARNSELHILNCYYKTTVGSSLAIGLGGGDKNTTCYIENTNFATIATVYKDYISTDGGTVGVQFDGCLKGTTSTAVTGLDAGTVTKPSYMYTPLSVTDVATYIPNATCGAGATLNVTAGGALSACSNLGIEDLTLNQSIKLYPTIVDTILNIDLSDTISGDATINIYSITGEKISSSSKKVAPNEKLSINLASLSKGIYLCNLKIGGFSTTYKFIKQ